MPHSSRFGFEDISLVNCSLCEGNTLSLRQRRFKFENCGSFKLYFKIKSGFKKDNAGLLLDNGSP